MTNSIPETVSFLELFHAKEVKEIGIRQKWETSESAKSLAVPIGYKGKDDIVYLNLHEKRTAHGLLAGTTGSGKSEFLQTYILSLFHFHPHEAAFLLIDYKGGGMAQPFRKMPHLLGTITNIEGSRNFSIRALASIKSELKNGSGCLINIASITSMTIQSCINREKRIFRCRTCFDFR